ncbi:neuronal membrane glycoprotein M6-a-like [Montipora foliosa]|uniref:neuronal membrane glycoprotein M6-a-like n=1 Tax=Montipora foliosa TaxID=591990 RepID=UPI0035F1EBFC
MCCGRLWLTLKKFIVRNLAHRAGLQKQHLLRCRKCNACCGSCNRCCCICLSRIPCASLIATFILGLGFTGFGLGLAFGVKNLNIWLQMDIASLASLGLLLFGAFLGSFAGMALLIGFASTGRTRFTCCKGWKCRLLGRCCVAGLFAWHYGALFIWILCAPLLIIPVIFMGIFFGVCQVKVVKQLGKTCINFEEYGLGDLVSQKEICGHDLTVFCEAMTGATPYFAVAFVGGMFIVVGTFHILFVLTANYAHIHDQRKVDKASECSTCRTCCTVKEPDRYEECFPEPPVEKVDLAMQDKLKLNAGDPEGRAHPHNHPHWEYVYDYEKSAEILGKKY